MRSAGFVGDQSDGCGRDPRQTARKTVRVSRLLVVRGRNHMSAHAEPVSHQSLRSQRERWETAGKDGTDGTDDSWR